MQTWPEDGINTVCEGRAVAAGVCNIAVPVLRNISRVCRTCHADMCARVEQQVLWGMTRWWWLTMCNPQALPSDESATSTQRKYHILQRMNCVQFVQPRDRHEFCYLVFNTGCLFLFRHYAAVVTEAVPHTKPALGDLSVEQGWTTSGR
jgi:hypothetical protein